VAKVAARLIRLIALHARAHRGPGKAGQLTRREHEVLRLIQADMSNKEIARTLGIELSTVKNRVHTTVEELSYEFRPAIRP
jgi:DNA-binding NarL/FixJ family response regulator